jgi:hypothetical protein
MIVAAKLDMICASLNFSIEAPIQRAKLAKIRR